MGRPGRGVSAEEHVRAVCADTHHTARSSAGASLPHCLHTQRLQRAGRARVESHRVAGLACMHAQACMGEQWF